MPNGYLECDLSACNRPMRATSVDWVVGEPGYKLPHANCQMPKGHRGRHASYAWYCDVCGKARRGPPAAQNDEVAVCFMCMLQSREGYV